MQNVTVTGYAAEGKAIARLDGKVIFIEGAVPGDFVDVLITKNRKDWAEGKVKRIITESPDRIKPFCIHFGTCRGCKWQMLPYKKQLESKEQEVRDVMQRIGKFEAPVLPILGAADTIHYRNKLEFTFSNKKYLSSEEFATLGDNQWPGGALGFHVPKLYDKIIDIRECWLMDDVNNAIRNTLREIAHQNSLSFYDIKSHSGFLRNVVIRYCTTGELMVNIFFGNEDKEKIHSVCTQLLEKIPSITTLLYTVNQKWNDSMEGLESVVFSGKGYVMEKLGAYLFKISAKSFFQTNTKQAEVLYSVVRDFSALTGKEIVYDLYCGTGSIGIFLSSSAKKIIGVEVVEEAVKDARENAQLNRLDHSSFFTGDVIEICNDAFFDQHGKADLVIVDPPRAGLHQKLIDKLIEINSPKIVYVSCNAATQARDLQKLKDQYEVEKIQPVDMFPHTHHIETVALLNLKNRQMNQ